MKLYQGRAALTAEWARAVEWDETGSLRVTDECALHGADVDELAYNAVFNQDPATVAGARSLISGAAAALGVRTESIKKLYDARGRREVGGFTVPAINNPRPDLRHRPRGLPRRETNGRGRDGVRARAQRDRLYLPAPG